MAKKIVTDNNLDNQAAFDYEDSRNYLIIKSNRRAWTVAIISLLVTLLLALAVLFLTPLKTVELAVVKVDKNGHIDIISDLSEQVIAPDEALNNHFIGQYVKTREQYYFNTLNKDFEKVQLHSNASESDKYIKSMIDKEVGKAELLKDKVEIEVNILSIVTKEVSSELTSTIRVDVLKKDSRTGALIDNSTKVITLTFEYLPIKLNAKSRLENPLGFVVTSYRVDEEIK